MLHKPVTDILEVCSASFFRVQESKKAHGPQDEATTLQCNNPEDLSSTSALWEPQILNRHNLLMYYATIPWEDMEFFIMQFSPFPINVSLIPIYFIITYNSGFPEEKTAVTITARNLHIHIHIYKDKDVCVHAMHAWGRRGTALLIPELSTKWTWLVNFTPQPLYP